MRPGNLRSPAAPGAATSAVLVAGVDGCRAGWVVATTGIDADSPTTIIVVPHIDPVLAALRSARLGAVGIDMPIGLPAQGHRAADAAARQLLGPRRSSLFPTPPRAALDATDFADALSRCRSANGKGMSIQAYNLLPKMRELASAIEPALQPRVSEVHPETSFAVLRGAPCTHPKRTASGSTERREALRAHFRDIDDLVRAAPRGAKVDDVLDALVAAWTARRMVRGDALVLGDVDARDERGYHVTITV